MAIELGEVGFPAKVSMSGKPAPIALFAYKRPDHLRRCIESLTANAEARNSDLLVFCDGARGEADAGAVAAVRDAVEDIRGFASVTPFLRERNLGLARSIVEGVGFILKSSERVIVVEDDLVVSPRFLAYMNSGLDLYADDENVASIHGYCYPVAVELPDTFFLRGADCWGWATWRRAWAEFRSDGAALYRELSERNLLGEFDLDGAYPFSNMLADQAAGRNDSWAVRWHATCFLNGRLTLYPGKSMVRNIGNDSSGTHSANTGKYDVDVADSCGSMARVALEPSRLARNAFINFLKPTPWGRFRRSAFRLLRACIRSAR